MERIEVEKEEKKVEYHIHQPKQRQNNEFIDWILAALVVIIIMAIIIVFFVDFNVETKLNIKKATTQMIFMSLATFCVGELSKRIFKRKGEKLKSYKDAEEEAKKEIKALNDSGFSIYAEDYCKSITETTIKRKRLHLLTSVGIDYDDYINNYCGKGFLYFFQFLKDKKLSFLQIKTIIKCNHIKLKPYNPQFITSYAAEIICDIVPSEQNNVNLADAKNTIVSILLSAGSSFGIGFIFYDVLVNFSLENIFLAIIKLILIAIIFALKAMFGWNLSVMETRRNLLRASEAKACVEYAKSKTLEKGEVSGN